MFTIKIQLYFYKVKLITFKAKLKSKAYNNTLYS